LANGDDPGWRKTAKDPLGRGHPVGRSKPIAGPHKLSELRPPFSILVLEGNHQTDVLAPFTHGPGGLHGKPRVGAVAIGLDPKHPSGPCRGAKEA
jgi:hypothetical protein